MCNLMTTLGLYTDGDIYPQIIPKKLRVFRYPHIYPHSNLRNPYTVESMVPPERLELPTH